MAMTRSGPLAPAGKAELRRRMRVVRRSIVDAAERSDRLWAFVTIEPVVRTARTVLAFDAMVGEPDAGGFVAWCRATGKTVVVPEGHRGAPLPEQPERFDLIVVPGLAFTAAGDRLGQGGGWYDRVLDAVRSDCSTIGVAFHEQIVEALPVEAHDRRVGIVITDRGRVVPDGQVRSGPSPGA